MGNEIIGSISVGVSFHAVKNSSSNEIKYVARIFIMAKNDNRNSRFAQSYIGVDKSIGGLSASQYVDNSTNNDAYYSNNLIILSESIIEININSDDINSNINASSVLNLEVEYTREINTSTTASPSKIHTNTSVTSPFSSPSKATGGLNTSGYGNTTLGSMSSSSRVSYILRARLTDEKRSNNKV